MGHLEDDLKTARPSTDPHFARRVMSSAVALQICYLDEQGNQHKAGSTVGSRTVEVPHADTWLIEPGQTLTETEWDTVIALMEEMQIPGLSAERQMTDALLERISKLDHLMYLGLQGSAQVTDAGLRHLARLPEMQHLDVSCPQVTDQGLEVLRHLPQLKTLKLVHQGRVSDAGLANLACCQHLECVNLMGTRTGDGAIRALIGNPLVRQLYSGNEVTDAGLALLHDFPVFKTWQGGETLMALMAFGAQPNCLLLRGSFTDRGLAGLVGLDGLFALNLDDGKLAVTAGGLKPLAELPNLGWLAFDATDEAMIHIGVMPRLRFLMCQDTVAGDEGFVALSRSQSIEYIWGRRCHNLTGRGFAALSAMPCLRGLSVSCKNVDEAALSALPRFRALREFMPMDVPDDGFRHVGRCELLEALHCMYCEDTTDAATGHIGGLSRLKCYEAWSTRITDRSLEILGRMPSLERLLFYNLAGVTDAGLADVAGLPRLREITLETLPRVTSEGAAVFPAAVCVNLVT